MAFHNQSEHVVDELYQLAANERRRIIIGTLLETTEYVTLDELVRTIIQETEDCYTHHSQFIETELKCRYLPTFSEAGFVEFDPERKLVKPQEELARFEEILPETYR